MNNVKERVELLIPATTVKKLDDYAKVIGETRSTVIRHAVNKYLDDKIDEYFKEG